MEVKPEILDIRNLDLYHGDFYILQNEFILT